MDPWYKVVTPRKEVRESAALLPKCGRYDATHAGE